VKCRKNAPKKRGAANGILQASDRVKYDGSDPVQRNIHYRAYGAHKIIIVMTAAEITEAVSSSPVKSVIEITEARVSERAARSRSDTRCQPDKEIVDKEDSACEASSGSSAARCKYCHGFADMIFKAQQITLVACLTLTHYFSSPLPEYIPTWVYCFSTVYE
jgi:hypothetical protein